MEGGEGKKEAERKTKKRKDKCQVKNKMDVGFLKASLYYDQLQRERDRYR